MLSTTQRKNASGFVEEIRFSVNTEWNFRIVARLKCERHMLNLRSSYMEVARKQAGTGMGMIRQGKAVDIDTRIFGLKGRQSPENAQRRPISKCHLQQVDGCSCLENPLRLPCLAEVCGGRHGA